MVNYVANEADLELVKQFLEHKEASDLDALREEANLQAEIALSSDPQAAFAELTDPSVRARYQARARLFETVAQVITPLSVREIAFGAAPMVPLGAKEEDAYSLFLVLEKLYSRDEVDFPRIASLRRKFDRAARLRSFSRPRVITGLLASALIISLGATLTVKHVMRGTDYAGVNWDRENLAGKVLDGYSLNDASLRAAQLQGASLKRTKLARTELVSANLGGATLREADLRGANLRDASLRDADLSGADLSGANLRGADLSGAKLVQVNLVGADLTGAKLNLAMLKTAKVEGAKFQKSSLSQATFEDVDLRRVEGLGDSDIAAANLGAGVVCPERCDQWLETLKKNQRSTTPSLKASELTPDEGSDSKPWVPRALQSPSSEQ